MSSWIAGWHPSQLRARPAFVPRGNIVVSMTPLVWVIGTSPAITTRRLSDTSGKSLIMHGACPLPTTKLEAEFRQRETTPWAASADWPGAFIAVAASQAETSVFGVLSGRTRIYYIVTDEGVMWASEVTPLAAYKQVGPDLALLALPLVTPSVDPYADNTPYPGVSVVAPGHRLVLKRDGGFTVERWYTPHSEATFASTTTRLRSVIPRSVGMTATLGQTFPTVSYSGGIDSGAVAVLAAKERQVIGMTYVDGTLVNDDLDHSRRIADVTPGLSVQVIRGGSSELPFAGLGGKLPRLDLPCAGVITLGRARRILEAASEFGGSVHFSGEGGDNVLGALRVSLADMIRAGKKAEAYRLAKLYAQLRHDSPRALIRRLRELASTTYADDVRQVAVQLLDVGHVQFPNPDRPSELLRWCHLSDTALWLSNDTRDALAQVLRQVAEAQEDEPSGITLDWLFARSVSRVIAAMNAVADDMGKHIYTPWLDNAVLRACFSIEGWERAPGNSFKPLVTQGMRDMLPEALTKRTTKGSFDNPHLQGLVDNAALVEEMLVASPLVKNGVVQVAPMLRSLRNGTNRFERPSFGIDIVLTATTWLFDLDSRRQTWWEEN